MTDYPPPPPPPEHGGPPQYPGGPQYQYPQQQPPPARSRGGCGRALLITLAVIGGLVVLVVILAAIGLGSAGDDDDGENTSGVETESGNTENPPQDDVTIDTCEAMATLNFATAKGTITNHSSKTSTYFIEINVTDEAGTVLGNAVSSVANVPAGGTAQFEAPSTVEMAQGVSCKIVEVNRVAS